jgi:hypothetical protein
MPSGEKLCAARDCGFAGRGGLLFLVCWALDFEFVWDFDMGISNFLFGCSRRSR